MLAALAVLLAARLYLLPQVGLLDYDSVFNWQVVLELQTGNFQHLFHHRSPGFFLFYAALAPLLPDFHWFNYVNAFLNALAVLVLARLVGQRLKLPTAETLLLGLTIGLSVFYVHTARYFTVESPALLLFALFLQQYLLRTEKGSSRHWFGALAWLALGLTFNYKFLLLLPVVLVTEALQEQPLLRGRVVWQSVGLLALPFVLYSLLAVAVGLPVYRYLASFLGLVQFDKLNPALRSGKFQSDLSFYFRYLLQFESPVSWLGLLYALWLLWKRVGQRLKGPIRWQEVLAILCLLFLGGMSLLLKAPRGLVFIYGLLYVLGFVALRRLVPGRVPQALVLLAGCTYSLFRCHESIYSYSQTRYPQVVAFLQQQGIGKVATTAGMGLLPYAAAAGIEAKAAVRPPDLERLQQEGFRYLLIDDYYRVTRLTHFGQTERLPPLLALPEPTLQSALLYLEHAEFTGLGYRQTLELRKQALQDTVQLQLVPLP